VGGSIRVLAAHEPSAVDRSQLALSQRLVVAPELDIEPPERMDLFWIVLTSGEDAPRGTDVLVKGLPSGVTLSAGHADRGRGWVAPLSALENLKIMVPPGFSGTLALEVALVDANGVVLDQHAAVLRVKPAAVTAPTAAAAHAVPPRPAKPHLVIAPVIDVEPAAASRLPVSAGRPDDIPSGAMVQVKGLPTSVMLSDGEPNAEHDWVVPVSALEELKIMVPPGISGRFNLDVALVDNSGEVVDGHAAVLRVEPPASAVPPEASVTLAVVPLVETNTADVAPLRAAAAVAAPVRPEADAPPRQEAAAPTTAPPQPPPAREPIPAVAAPSDPTLRAETAGTAPQAVRLVEKGDLSFAQGNIAEARQYFKRAVDLGFAIAALKLAETYDPHELARPNVFGVKPNPGEARRWYQRAVELKVRGAPERVQRLGTR